MEGCGYVGPRSRLRNNKPAVEKEPIRISLLETQGHRLSLVPALCAAMAEVPLTSRAALVVPECNMDALPGGFDIQFGVRKV